MACFPAFPGMCLLEGRPHHGVSSNLSKKFALRFLIDWVMMSKARPRQSSIWCCPDCFYLTHDACCSRTCPWRGFQPFQDVEIGRRSSGLWALRIPSMDRSFSGVSDQDAHVQEGRLAKREHQGVLSSLSNTSKACLPAFPGIFILGGRTIKPRVEASSTPRRCCGLSDSFTSTLD